MGGRKVGGMLTGGYLLAVARHAIDIGMDGDSVVYVTEGVTDCYYYWDAFIYSLFADGVSLHVS